MRQPLRRQLFLPIGVLAALAMAALSAVNATVSARARQADALQRLASVVETLQASQFPFTPAVVSQMHGLSEAEFVVRDRNGEVTASTLDDVPMELGHGRFAKNDTLNRLTAAPSVRIGTTDFYAVEMPLANVAQGGTLLVLVPVQAWRQLGWTAAWPPLATGLVATLAVVLLARWLANRFTRRLEAIRAQVLQIAEGSADRLSLAGPDDELRQMASAVNTVSDQLRQHERAVRQTERMRLVAQLSSGLAHQLRNAASGARLAVQLVQRRHPEMAEKELSVALKQLELIEDHIKRLLAVGPDREAAKRPGTVEELFASLEDLAGPVARHAGVSLELHAGDAVTAAAPDFDRVRSGLLNLVMNGIEAAGRGGRVAVEAVRNDAGWLQVSVADSGPGPGDEIADRIFEPFVTSKPEGVGLGLAYVRKTIEQLGGTVSWRREHGQTLFTLAVPATDDAACVTTMA